MQVNRVAAQEALQLDKSSSHAPSIQISSAPEIIRHWDWRKVKPIFDGFPETVKIRVKNTIFGSEQPFYINKMLLSRLSPYYKAAFGSGFSESTKEIFVMELSCDDMYVFAMWMCGGGLVYHGKHPGLKQLIRLYVFADYYDFPAFRRTIMSLVKFDRYAFRDLLPYQLYDYLSQLSPTSPLYQWLGNVWAHHVYEHVDDLSLQAHRLENNMPEDLRELVRSTRSERRPLLLCRCCHDPCDYHEHQSEHEWEMTCHALHRNTPKPDPSTYRELFRRP